MAGLNSEKVGLLYKNGYIVRRKIGEGYFRSAYEVLRDDSSLERFVAKVYDFIERESVQHRINTSKKLEEQETRILKDICHPNIIRMHDVLQENDNFITIEEHFNAISLEDKVRIQGPIRNTEYLRDIFSQTIDALRYLHLEKGILHRDLKPSNILLGRKNDEVKLVDFQTARLVDEIREKILPTRGATSYTHPELINALLQGRSAKASITSEFYAFGAVLYYVTTGCDLFQYSLKENKKGVPLQIGDETVNVLLKEERRKIPNIDLKKHDSYLKQKLAPFSRSFQEFLFNLLSVKRNAYAGLTTEESYKKLEKEIENAFREEIFSISQRKIGPGEVLGLLIERGIDIARDYGRRSSEVTNIKYLSEKGTSLRENYFLESDRVLLCLSDVLLCVDKGGSFQGELYLRILNIFYDDELVFRYDQTLGGERAFGGKIRRIHGKEGTFASTFISPTYPVPTVFHPPYFNELLTALRLK